MSEVLTTETIKEIDHWLSKFPLGKQRSAIIGSLHAAQHQNHGFLTSELMDAVAAYIDCLLYTSPSPRDYAASRMPSSA